MVLIARAAADADGADDLSIAFQWNATCEDHDSAIIGGVNAEELSAGLRMYSEVFGRDVEGARRVGLLLRNIDAADPSPVHAHMGHDVAALVSHCDVHGLSNFLRLLLGGRNHATRIFQFHCRHASSSKICCARAAGAAISDIKG